MSSKNNFFVFTFTGENWELYSTHTKRHYRCEQAVVTMISKSLTAGMVHSVHGISSSDVETMPTSDKLILLRGAHKSLKRANCSLNPDGSITQYK